MTVIGSNNLLAMRKAIIEQNDALQKAGKPEQHNGTEQTGATSFGAQMKDALEQVNGLQQDSATARTDYELGRTTDIAEVMLAKQKASIGFEATLQVRNKLLSAYKDIMNMPV
jgi:flagellar hook-basal body complex protein FliE